MLDFSVADSCKHSWKVFWTFHLLPVVSLKAKKTRQITISCWLFCALNHDQNKQLAMFPQTLCLLSLDVITATCWWLALTLQRNVLRLSIHSSVCTCLHLNAGCKWHISPSPSCLLPTPVSTCPCLSALISINLAVKVNINPFYSTIVVHQGRAVNGSEQPWINTGHSSPGGGCPAARLWILSDLSVLMSGY